VAREKKPWPKAGRWRPSLWAGWMPNGIGQVKPNHYWEMVRTAWQNKRRPLLAWRILTRGVCDGCALGTSGLYDHTMKGVHLCTVRLNLLRLNTMDALDVAKLEDVAPLRNLDAAELRALGRLPYPMVRRKGEPGFTRVGWDEALDLLAGRVRATDPRRLGFYFTSRGLTNENYYVGQKVARFLGTNHVDNSSRICHAPSTNAMKGTLGVAASTCSYSDWIGTDLLVFFGSDVPNNQPVTTKYLFYAKKAGTKILVVNPYREPGLERYWVPSVLESAIFGTKMADDWFQVHTGGDIPFIYGVVKRLLEKGAVDEAFIHEKVEDWPAWRSRVEAAEWKDLEQASGASREDMERFADLYAGAKSAVFVWSMGLTQHRFGVDNVKAVCNLALLRGMVGREKTGLMPIRGHSGVQGGAEMGCVPNAFPMGEAVNPETAKRWSEAWGFPVPDWPGWTAVDLIDAAHNGSLDILWSVGGNWLDTLPEPDYVQAALERVPVRVHQDIVLTPQMLLDPADVVVLLPATTRYEQPGGGTETSTERYVYFSPEIPGRRIGQARTEWQVLTELAARVHPDRARGIRYDQASQIRAEIDRLVPTYHGIGTLRRQGDSFQWGGTRLCEGGAFPTPDGKGHVADVPLPHRPIPDGHFLLSTRRGKQFNSLVHAHKDPLTGARREDVLMAPEDAQRLSLNDGDAVRLVSDVGQMPCRVRLAPIRPGNLQVHWPEGNVLIRRGVTDPVCGIPDYNAIVRVEPLAAPSKAPEPEPHEAPLAEVRA
jgi:molybdopterin-dependent oxidoreductase alpha subunit